MFESNTNIYVMYYSNKNTLTNINKVNIIKYICELSIKYKYTKSVLINIILLILLKYKDLYNFSSSYNN